MLPLPVQEVGVRYLVRELRSYMPRDQKNSEQKPYCNQFNKDIKNGPTSNNIFKRLHQ